MTANRLIERHPSNNVYFWTSYDFAGNQGKRNLFEFPLAPGGTTGFTHDGGETSAREGTGNIVSDPENLSG